MNAKERYLGMLAGRSVDIVPRVPILMQFAAEWIGSNYGAFASDFRVLVEANCRCAAEFGFDQLSAISDPYRETSAFGAEIQIHQVRSDREGRCTSKWAKKVWMVSCRMDSRRTATLSSRLTK